MSYVIGRPDLNTCGRNHFNTEINKNDLDFTLQALTLLQNVNRLKYQLNSLKRNCLALVV